MNLSMIHQGRVYCNVLLVNLLTIVRENVLQTVLQVPTILHIGKVELVLVSVLKPIQLNTMLIIKLGHVWLIVLMLIKAHIEILF